MAKKTSASNQETPPKAKKAAVKRKVATPKKEEALKKKEAELAAEKEKFVRLFAEFENFKKRTAKERLELFKTANQEVLTALLPIVDDFDRAVAQTKKAEAQTEVQGFVLIYNKFLDTLKSNGLEAAAAAKGDVFDAELHEAITQIPAPTKKDKGKIIDVVEKGYKLGDRTIRYPKVVVGQ